MHAVYARHMHGACTVHQVHPAGQFLPVARRRWQRVGHGECAAPRSKSSTAAHPLPPGATWLAALKLPSSRLLPALCGALRPALSNPGPAPATPPLTMSKVASILVAPRLGSPGFLGRICRAPVASRGAPEPLRLSGKPWGHRQRTLHVELSSYHRVYYSGAAS